MQKLSVYDRIQIPAVMHPGFRTSLAIQNGVERKILFRTWGGIGDQICAEPTLRHAINKFKDCEIYLASELPELFLHLKFAGVFDLKKEKPNYSQYLCFETITPPDESNMVWLFFSHMLTNCVDFPSLCALRSQLPVAEKEVKLPDVGYMPDFEMDRAVVIHPGKHWQSKTFPKEFWDSVINRVIQRGALPVIIGANTDDNRGTVEVMTNGAIDLRNRLSIPETVSLLKKSKCLLTNDSSPLHMAVDSDCWIGFIATCKHPDMISHWRRGEWSWRMVNHGRGGFWDIVDYCPNKKDALEAEFIDPKHLLAWLPDPVEFADWGVDKL